MFPVGLIGPALSLGAGLFGGKSNDAANRFRQQQQGAISAANTIGNQFGEYGNQQMTRFGKLQGLQDAALDNEANYLKRDFGTDQNDASYLNHATAGATDAYNNAASNITATLARRGMGNSSMAAGALTGLAANKAKTFANAQQQLASYKINRNDQQRNQLLGLYTNNANNAWNMGSSALHTNMGEDQWAAGQYGGMYGQQMAQDNASNNALGQAAGTAGSLIGQALYKRKQQTDGTYTDNWGF